VQGLREPRESRCIRAAQGWKGEVRAHRAFGDKSGSVNPARSKTAANNARAYIARATGSPPGPFYRALPYKSLERGGDAAPRQMADESKMDNI